MWPFERKSTTRGMGKQIAAEAAKRGVKLDIESGPGYQLAKYTNGNGVDRDAYRAVQNIGNRAKLNKVYAAEGIIDLVAEHAKANTAVSGILCHGTRNGAELRMFAKHFPQAEVLGTEIADTADQFPNTIQWDFHDFREDWRGRWDVIYSNSWDHALEPLRAFASWSDSLRPSGLMYLEHSSDHLNADDLDLFGATRAALTSFVIQGSGKAMSAAGAIEAASSRTSRAVLVFKKAA